MPGRRQRDNSNAELEATSLANLMDQQQVQILLSHLSRRQRQILSLRFGLEGNGGKSEND
ncbi:MAG: hypothetical protein QGI86_09735 [Candidatus Poribacteria bacterium]|nr:hypothetical protein [Candidatus Poribacteria bacterium]